MHKVTTACQTAAVHYVDLLRRWAWLILILFVFGIWLEYLHNYLFPIPSVMAEQLWTHRTAVVSGVLVSTQHVLVGLTAGYLIGYPIGMAIPLFKKAEWVLSRILYLTFGVSRYAWALVIYITVPDTELPIGNILTLTRADLFCVVLGILYTMQPGRDAAAAIVLHDKNGNVAPLLLEFSALGFYRRYHLFRLLLWPMTRHKHLGALITATNYIWMSMIYVEPLLDPLGHGIGQMTYDALMSHGSFGMFYGYLAVIAVGYAINASTLQFVQEKRIKPRWS